MRRACAPAPPRRRSFGGLEGGALSCARWRRQGSHLAARPPPGLFAEARRPRRCRQRPPAGFARRGRPRGARHGFRRARCPCHCIRSGPPPAAREPNGPRTKGPGTPGRPARGAAGMAALTLQQQAAGGDDSDVYSRAAGELAGGDSLRLARVRLGLAGNDLRGVTRTQLIEAGDTTLMCCVPSRAGDSTPCSTAKRDELRDLEQEKVFALACPPRQRLP